ncbi:carbohydrate sulfotransferase 11-like [Ptychodera flava]|uniref:carbohydrate sulfotransferase 11-like n=1 Tax=Ptychodera flava TaxID=63121 RepID=UPI00396A9ECF
MMFKPKTAFLFTIVMCCVSYLHYYHNTILSYDGEIIKLQDLPSREKLIKQKPESNASPVNDANRREDTLTTAQQLHQRQSLLNSGCEKARKRGIHFDSKGFRGFVIDDNYRFLYCPVAKAAEANWKRTILVLKSQANTTDELQYFEVLGKDGKLYQVTNNSESYPHYTKFFFTRHPFKRLLSAYRNKFEFPDKWGYKYAQDFGTQIIKQYRKNASQHSLETGTDVTFKEFIQYVLDREDFPEDFNMHWRPIYISCDVCNHNYNFVGKLETIEEDALYILKHLNASHVVKVPQQDTSSKHVTNSSRNDIYYKYFGALSETNLKRLYKLYELDFLLFGYDFPSDLIHRQE